DWGDRCDTDSAKVRIPTVYAMACVPVFDGDNGGATTGGPPAATIRIVRYVPQANDAAASFGPLAAAADDSQDEQHQTMQDYFDIYSSQAELYGRPIELIDYPATGAAPDR